MLYGATDDFHYLRPYSYAWNIMKPEEDLYDLLKVPRSASTDEIRKAFKKMAIEHHPDKTAGDKEKEEMFKKINEAYSVLSDPQKKDMYDKFGVVDGGGGPPPGDMNDILKGMFGGGGGPGGGFSFVFGGGDGMGMDDFFGQMFGGPPPRPGASPSELIDIPLSLNEIYHGVNKKVEFELLDVCSKSNGCGASDPNQILKCMMCKGEGKTTVQLNPFVVTTMLCESCQGSGSTVKNGKFCPGCKGKKTQYTKKTFELNIPRGINHGHQVKMDGKGSWNERAKQYGTMVFRVLYNVQPPFSVQGLDVHYKMNITLEDLLCGFEKDIDLYGTPTKICSRGYFNPQNPAVINGRGLVNKKNQGNLVIEWVVVFEDNVRLAKYNDVFQKVLKRKQVETKEGSNVIVVS